MNGRPCAVDLSLLSQTRRSTVSLHSMANVGRLLKCNRPQGRRGIAIPYVPCAQTPHVVVERAVACPYVYVEHTSCAIASTGTEGRLSSYQDASGTVKQLTQFGPVSQSTRVRRLSSTHSYDQPHIEFRSQFESTWREVIYVSRPQFSASEARSQLQTV